MEIRIEPYVTQSFEDFCDEHGLSIVVKERPPSLRNAGRWYASSDPYVEIKTGAILASTHGNGATPEEAIADFAKRIAGKLLVSRSTSSSRKTFEAPEVWAEPLQR